MLRTGSISLPALLVATTLLSLPAPVLANDQLPCRETARIVIGHRGASGYAPEHTLASYALAIEMGADYIEPDLVITKDGVLVARHEPFINETTDVADHPEFASHKQKKTIDGVEYDGWFAEDFTLAELKTLRARERLPALRTANTRFDGFFEIPTFYEVIDLARSADARFELDAQRTGETTRRCLGIYPETKHPSYFKSIGLPLEGPLLKALRTLPDLTEPRKGSKKESKKESKKVFIQSFEVSNLKELSGKTKLPLIQLIDASGKPYDFVLSGDKRTYADLVTPAGLAEIATYADGVGVNKTLMIPHNPDDSLGESTGLVTDAHAAGLIVHGWTFRAENNFLPSDFDIGSDPAGFGNLDGEIDAYLKLGMDGFFTDQPNIGVRARDVFVTTS